MAADVRNDVGSAERDEDIDLRAYADVIWRRKNVILAIVLLACAVALILVLLTPVSWMARTTVMVPDSPSAQGTQVVAGIQVSTPSVVYSQETYARLLKSRIMIDRVVERLNLRMKPEDLAQRIGAKPIRDTRLIELTVRGNTPEEPQQIATILAEALVEYDRKVISAEVTQARTFIEGQLAGAMRELQTKEQSLKEFNQRENLAAIEAEATRRLTDLSALRRTYDQNRIDLGVGSRRLAELKQEVAAISPLRLASRSTEADNLERSVSAQLRTRLAEMEAQRAALTKRYASTYPAVVAVDAQITQTRRALADAEKREPRAEAFAASGLREQLETQRAVQEVEVAGLQAKDALLKQAIEREALGLRLLNAHLAGKRAELNRLTREADMAKGAFTAVSTKATEALIAEGMKGGFVRIVDKTAVQQMGRGVVPKLTLAVFLGLLAGAVMAFVLEFFGVPSGRELAWIRSVRAVEFLRQSGPVE